MQLTHSRHTEEERAKCLRNVSNPNVVPLDLQEDTAMENIPYGAADSMKLLQNALSDEVTSN